MRSKLSQYVRKEFEKKLKVKLPDFKKVKCDNVPPGYPVYEKKVIGELAFYVCLMISPRRDAFTVDVGWNSKSMVPGAMTGLYRDVKRGRELFRIGQLWDAIDGFWWELGDGPYVIDNPPLEECIEKVMPYIDDCIEKIILYAIPYFHEVASKLEQEYN